MPFITEIITYEVEKNTDYFLSVVIGNGVSGGATTMVDFQGKLHSPTVTNVPIGKGSEIAGKSLPVRSTFADSGPAQFAGVDYVLNDLVKSVSRPKNGEEFWTFKTTIKFKLV